METLKPILKELLKRVIVVFTAPVLIVWLWNSSLVMPGSLTYWDAFKLYWLCALLFKVREVSITK